MGFHITKADQIGAAEAKAKQQKKARAERRQRRELQEQAAGAATTKSLESQIKKISGGLKGKPTFEDTDISEFTESKLLDNMRTLGPSELASLAKQPAEPVLPRTPTPVREGSEPAPAAASAPEEPGSPAGDGEGSEGGAKKPQRKRRAFSQSQLSEMVRNHAFSGGCRTYKQFSRKAEPEHKPRADSSLKELEAQRRIFYTRDADDFGVELLTRHEEEAWSSTTRGLGQRSASEGALLRYAHSAVDDMTRSVQRDLNIDVSRISRKQLRRPSFASHLDTWGVSPNPADASSATGQAVRRLCKRESQSTSGNSLLSLPPVNSPDRGPASSGRARGRR